MNTQLMIKLIEENTCLENVEITKRASSEYITVFTPNSSFSLNDDDFNIKYQYDVKDKGLGVKEIISLNAFIVKNAHRLANAYAMTPKPLDYNTAVFNIATKIHHVQCNWNHTDACGWFYDDFGDEWNKEGKETDGRNDYCIKAHNFLQQILHMRECNFAQAVTHASLFLLALHKENWNERLQDAFSKIDEDYPCF